MRTGLIRFGKRDAWKQFRVPADVDKLAASAFAKWSGKAPPEPTFFRPTRPEALELYLVDRPGSTQAEIFVATLGPERQSEDWVRAEFHIAAHAATRRCPSC